MNTVPAEPLPFSPLRALLLPIAAAGAIVTALVLLRPVGPPTGDTNPQAAADYEPNFTVQDFSLTREDGTPFGKADLLKQPSVVSFFFASCPGPCRELNQQVKRLQDEFGPQGVRFVSVTVDPENDSPAILTQYGINMGADPKWWIFLTGDPAAVRELATKSFHVAAEAGTGDHRVSHSDRLLLVDRTGTVRGTYPAREPIRVEMLRKKLAALLKEPS